MVINRREFIKTATSIYLDLLAGAPVTGHIANLASIGEYKNAESVKNPLRYGITDGNNIPFMPKGKSFCVGYNDKYGLINVHEDKGEPYFEGRINVEDLLPELQSKDQEEINERLEDYTMKPYLDSRKTPNSYNSEPIMEVLTDKRHNPCNYH